MTATAHAEEAITRVLHGVVGDRPVILGGSRAAGTSDADSDWDLFVVVPLHRAPVVLGGLARAAERLSAELRAPVTVNPLPVFRWRRPERNLLVWKLWQEGRVLGGHLPALTTGAAPLTAHTRSSYAISGLRYLVAHVDPCSDVLDADARRDLRKALLHLAQLDLWGSGRHAATLEEAVGVAPDRAWAGLAQATPTTDAWLRARDLLAATVAPPAESLARVLAVNLQYCALSTIRGRRPQLAAIAGRPSVRQRFWSATELLARAVRWTGGPDSELVEQACAVVPDATVRRLQDWLALRNYLERQWPHADPIVGL